MSSMLPDTPENRSEIILYQTEDGRNRVQVRMDRDTAWLSLNQMAELFQRDKSVISKHIANVFEEGELEPEATVARFATVQSEGDRRVARQIEHYNLDVIISVGYRVKSQRGTQFRIWATQRLREYLIKGFTLDDDRLKGRDGAADYFDELLARIRDIRASEKRVYQRIREIFALASDYVEGGSETQVFFATMQNKMHCAAAGSTAAEIIRRRADSAKANMGLTAWSGSRVLKRDVSTAKNYLSEKEIDTLNRIVVMFLDQAQFRAERRQDIRTRDWTALLDKFLRDTELPVLASAGAVSRDEATEWALEQYDAFAERRRLETEAAAEARYLDDLRTSAETLEDERRKLPAAEKKPAKRRKKNGKRDGGRTR